MKKVTLNLFIACAVLLSFVMTGCGSKDSSNSPTASNAPKATVFGSTSMDPTADGTVTVKDSSVPAQEKTAPIDSRGAYTVDVSGLTPPFMLKAEGTVQAGNGRNLYSISKNCGRANINPLSDTALAASANTEPGALYLGRSSEDERHRTADNFEQVISRLRTVLAPLFALYQISGNAVSDDDDDDDENDNGDDDNGKNKNSGLRAMFRDVRFTVTSRSVIVTNRLTGGIIFSGRLNDLSAGTFYPENMPAGPGGSTACTYTYDTWSACQNGTQTRNLLTSSPAGCTGTPILSQACTSVPPTPVPCTYTYGAWGACLSSGTQLRSLLTSTPAGCSGTPVLTRNCTPPAQACNGYNYSAWDSCVNNTQTRTVTSLSPTGCTGTPTTASVLSQACTPSTTACTGYNYSAWGTCVNNSQTRTVTSLSPAGCVGTPTTASVLSQACTPPAPACTSYNYSAWGTCVNNSQTRTVTSLSPAGCVGTPTTASVLSQACVSPTPVCGSCHAIPPATGQHDFHVNSQGYDCSRCHGTGYSSTAVTATTHQNGVRDVVSTLNYNATTRSCGSPGCHGSRTW